MAFVKAVPIEGLSIYGIQQKDYTVEGLPHCDYVKAASTAMLKESTAIEAEATAYAAVLKARQKKLDELGWSLSVLVKAISSMEVGSQGSDDLSSSDDDLWKAQVIVNRYYRDQNKDMILPLSSDSKVRRDDATKLQAALQYEIDFETNEMQQDMVTMQSLVSKRDNAFSTASSLIQKINSTATSIIGNIS